MSDISAEAIVAYAALMFSGFAIMISILQYWKSRKAEYDMNASNGNQAYVLDKEFASLILKVREEPEAIDRPDMLRYNVHLLGLLQFFDSHLRLLKSFRGQTYCDRGYGLLLKSALNCEAGKRFWVQNKVLFNPKLQAVVEDLMACDAEVSPPVLYP